MGYDLDPLRCIEEKKKFLARAIAEQLAGRISARSPECRRRI
jgi:hypothetical protein